MAKPKSKCVHLPIVEYGGYDWGALAFLGKDHEITCETFQKVEEKYSFKDGHRVRIYRLKKNVYWRLPSSALQMDITDVAPRRLQGRDRS